MKVVIDRFEGQYAVCEKPDRSMIDIERSKLPVEAKEVDVLVLQENNITIDKEETEERKKEIEILTEDLWN